MSERGGRAGVLDRIHKLLALASSPNEHEARTAAVLAAKLIRQHRVVLAMPPATPAARPTPPGSKKKTPGSKRGTRQVADVPERIVSPLGGDCTHCGGRYRSGATVYWFSSGGGMHPACFQEWLKTK